MRLSQFLAPIFKIQPTNQCLCLSNNPVGFSKQKRLFTNHCCCCYIKRLIPDWWDRQADLKRSHWPFCQFIAKHFCNFVSLHFCICISTYAFCICISLHFCICIYLHFRMFKTHAGLADLKRGCSASELHFTLCSF